MGLQPAFEQIRIEIGYILRALLLMPVFRYWNTAIFGVFGERAQGTIAVVGGLC